MEGQKVVRFSDGVEHEQIQKRTFTNWINAQLAKKCPPSFVSDLFSDLRDGSHLLDLLEVVSGQSMKRQRGHGVFQQRANIETALNFLKKKSLKLVNINIPDIIDGRPSIILGLVWTIVLHCHIEELASALSFSSRHSSLDSLTSLDSWSGSPVPASSVPAGRTSPLHRRFRVSAKKALLMWVRDQCQRVHCSVSVKDFKTSWRSGEAFLAILCSLRPQLVNLSQVQYRSNQENLEEAFHLAERELHIPRLLEPQDVDVKVPDEKSIMTYVAQFLQYSNDMPAPDDHLQLFPQVQPSSFSPVNLPCHFTPAIAVSPLHQVPLSERAQDMTCWLQQAYQELSEAWASAEKSSYAEKYQVFQGLAGSLTEQKRPVITLLAAIRRCPELNKQQRTLKAAWDCLDEKLQKCKADLDLSLPPPLDSVVVWLQRAEAGITEEGGTVKDHADAAKEARAKQDTIKALIREMGHYANIVDTYQIIDDSGNVTVPHEKFDEIKNCLTHIRITAKYQGIKLQYQESHHTMLDRLSQVKAKVKSWKAPYKSQESIHVLLQDWHETVERQDLLLILMDSLQNMKEKAGAYTSKGALGGESQLVVRQVKEAESEAELATQNVTATRETMERVVSAWEMYNRCLTSLQAWLTQAPAEAAQDMSEWTSCQAQLNEVGNFLIEVTETSTSLMLAEQLGKVNMQWAECMKKTVFESSSEPSVGASYLQTMPSLTQEGSWLLRQTLEVASVPLKTYRQKLQLLRKKMAEVDMTSLSPSPDTHFPQILAEAERTCVDLQRAASRMEGCLAELDHWSTDAMDCYQLLKEKTRRGHSASEHTAKVLIPRGLQLLKQVVTEGQDLQELVAGLQKISPLQHLSTSVMQDRITEAVSHCQEIHVMFSSIGFKQQVGESPKLYPETGVLVVARTKHVDQVGSVMLQTQDPKQCLAQIPSHTAQQRTTGHQVWCKNKPDEKAVIQRTSQTAKKANSSPAQPSCFTQSDQLLPAVTQTPAGLMGPPRPLLSSPSPVTAEKPGSSPSQSRKSTTQRQPSKLQSNKPSYPPVMEHSEVHSKAQSMAKSRLEKARCRLQGRIQQAMKLFGVKEISESQAKRKQKALKILQPAVLEEFLGAVEGFGAFCSGPQFQDVTLLSNSVRKQWEDVRREMAAFVPFLWSKIRERKQSFSAVQCEMQTNTVHDSSDLTHHDSVQQQQAVTEGAESMEDCMEPLRELSETLTQRKFSSPTTDQQTECQEVQGGQPSDTALLADGRGQQLEENTQLGAPAATQPNNDLPQKQSVGPLEHLSSTANAASAQLRGDISQLPTQDIPTEVGEQLTQGVVAEKHLKPSLRAKEQLLKARLLHITTNIQQTQAVVRSNTVENKQEAEWTIIAETSQENRPAGQEVLESYRKSCTAFESQLQENKLHLEQFVPHPVTILNLQDQKKQLQTLKQDTEALWFEVELQYTQVSAQLPQLMSTEEERKKKQLTQQWRDQQMCLQSSMVSLQNTDDLLESADNQMSLITEKLSQIIGGSVDICSMTTPTLLSDIQEMNDQLQAQIRKLTEHSTEDERQVVHSPLCQSLQKSVHHLEDLRQKLEKVQSAAQDLDGFLATVKKVMDDIPTMLTQQDPSRQENEADWEQETHSWQEAMMQRLQEQSDNIDCSLKAVGMTLTMNSATVTCQDVVNSVSEQFVEMGEKLKRAREKHKGEESCHLKGNEQSRILEYHSPRGTEEEPGLESKRSKLEGEAQKEEEQKAQIWRAEVDVVKAKDQRQRGRSSQVKKKGGEKESLFQRRDALLAALRETKGAAEQLGLKEPTLPALQQRKRALTALESGLAGFLHELQYIQGASSHDESQTREAEDLWEETTKAVVEPLEQCCVLTELLKRFQSIRAELSGMLQRAESTISEQASYMGKDNVQKLHTKVQEIKAELNGLGDRIEEVRSVCRQLQTHLRHIPDCSIIPFESEADALMDRWLDISERTDTHLENLHLSLTLWEGVLQLGAEVESWTDDKLTVFAQCPSFKTEDDIVALQNEIVTQEESVQHFHQRAAEIQTLLQSRELPLELQVVESQVRKKIEQLKELLCEAEYVYKQMVATKAQITGRMMECFNALHMIKDSLLTLSGPDVTTVLSKLKELCWQLQMQDEQAESLLEDVHIMASIASAESLQSLSVSGMQLQEKVRNTHQLFSEVQEQTERNIRDLDRLQTEKEHLELWLNAVEEKAVKDKVSMLQEEVLQQSERTELLSQLVPSLQSSNLQQVALLEESEKLLERYHSILAGPKGAQASMNRDVEGFQALCESTQSWIGDVRRTVDSLPASLMIRSPVEQRLHCAQIVLKATEEGEARLEQLRVKGDSLNHRLLDRDDLKQKVQKTFQKTQQQWRDLLQSVEPYYSVLQADPEPTTFYLAQRQEACCRVDELRCQTDQLPTSFSWPGTAERTQTCLLAHELQDESEYLQLTLTKLAEQRKELAEGTGNTMWKDSSWVELDTHCSALTEELKGVCSRLKEGVHNEEHFGQLLQDCHHKLTSLQERMSVCQTQRGRSAGIHTDAAALEALLQEVAGVDLLQLETLKDSIAVSSTSEAQAGLSQQVSNLQKHKRALESSIKENLANQGIPEEVSYLQTALKKLAENVENLSEVHDVLTDIHQLKQQWCRIQDLDTQLTEVEARVNDLQSSTQESPLADVTAVFKELVSLRSTFLQKKQVCSESTANRVREAASQLQQWSQTVQAEPSSHSQVVLAEGLQLQQALHDIPLEQECLLNSLGTEMTKKQETVASGALSQSQAALESLSEYLVSHGHRGALTEKTTGRVENSESDQNDNDIKSKVEADATKQEGSDMSVVCAAGSLVGKAEEEDALTRIQCSGMPEVFTSKTQQESQQVSSLPPKIYLRKLENVPEHLSAQSETLQVCAHAQERGKYCEDVSVMAKKVVTVVLDMEPESLLYTKEAGTCSRDDLRCSLDAFSGFPEVKQGHFTDEADQKKQFLPAQYESAKTKKQRPCVVGSQKVFTIVLDVQQSENVGTKSPDVVTCSGPGHCDAELTEASASAFPEMKSNLDTPLISPQSDEPDSKIQSAHATSPCSENYKSSELKHNEVLTSSSLCCTGAAEHQLTAADETETTFPDVTHKGMTCFCHSVQAGAALTKAKISTPDSKQVTAADTAQNKGTACEEMTEQENREEASTCECIESRHSEVPQEGSEWKSSTALEDTGMTRGQPQIQASMEPERTPPGLSADLRAAKMTGESPKRCQHRSTMQDILSEIQSLVERSNIINRRPHIDLNWYLKLSPGEPEIRLLRTVQQVLACRYQPAQLSVTAMAKQLEDAEEYRCCVQEQVATMKNMSVSQMNDPNALKRAEGQWSAALLDASATVQVKAAQLDQVKQYHRQMKITRAFLEVLTDEKNKVNLNALGSSALQADKLHALLKSMKQKKDTMEDLLHISSQLSVHLSDAESSGTLLAQLGDVQEEWRLLEGSIKRALSHAFNATSQSSLLLKNSKELKAKLEALMSGLDGKSALEFICLTTDLKLYNQLYRHLQSQSDALIQFSLGQKEKDEIYRKLQGLGSLFSVTKTKLDSFTDSCEGKSSTKINKQLRDLIVWAKQAENHISIGKTLALFPEEALIQIVEMRKFQADIFSKRSKVREHIEKMKDMEKDENEQVLKTVEDLYEAIADSLDHVLDTMKKSLNEREKLLCQLASLDAWFAETHAKRDPCSHVENVSKTDIRKLESELKSHRLAAVEIENQLKLLEGMSESCKKIAIELSPGESRYLVNRLLGLWTELDGLLAHEKATSWELEELIHERTNSDEELSTIQASLQRISADLEQLKFPLTQETFSVIAHWKHMLMEHQCQVQELQHCQEAKRSPLLCSIGELQDRCKVLSINTFEQDKYMHLRRQMEESRDIAKEQIQHAKNKTITVGKRFKLCQTLLVELPLVKTQCQEAADQLEAIAQELHPSELDTEREKIHSTVETLVSWEHSVTEDIKNVEAKLLLGLQFNSELSALVELLQSTRVKLEEAQPVSPDEKAIDVALRRYWVIWRNMDSGMRVLEGLARKEKINLRNNKDLYSLREAAMQECHSKMVSLSQARESLKDYQWAAQGAIGFLHNAEATFLSAPGGFLDCTEEQRQTQQALEALEDGFQAHIFHLMERVPEQPCLSRPKTEQLHIGILSQLLVGRAVLEAQAQLRLESLQRCEVRQQSHKKCHEDIRQRLSGFEARLSECAAEQVMSYEKCVAQQRRAKLLMEDLRRLAVKIEDLRAGCPMQGCGVGKDGELGALWRRWVSLRRGVGLLMAHTEQRGEEWKDITTSMEQCCSFLASLQAEVPDSSTVSFTQEEPQELLVQAEMHQAGLEQEQQALASLEHRLEHVLSLSTSQDPISPGPVGKTLVKIQENVRSLKERNLQVVAAAQAEEKQREQVQEGIGEVEKHVIAILPVLEACSNLNERQELRNELSSQRNKLKFIMDSVQRRYEEIPSDIGRLIKEVELLLQKAEEQLIDKNSPVRRLASRARELGSGLERVKVLLEKRSPTVSEAQNALKHVWDELDSWHSSLMLLESEMQDLAEEQPDQAQLLIDQLTQPLQLYQDAAQMAEHRTAFLSKIPACLQEFKDVMDSATCWLDEAQSWLSAPCSFTTARSLQNHAKSLQLVLEDSERIRHNLQNFRSLLDEVSAVCDTSTQAERLDQTDQNVQKMQRSVLEPLEKLLQAVAMVEVMEDELKAVEKNIPKIKTILSSVDITNIPTTEHLHNQRVILASVRSMQRTLEEIERCKGELHLPQGSEEGLSVFFRATLLLQPLQELEVLTKQQGSLLENKMREKEEEPWGDFGIPSVSNVPVELQELDRPPHRCLVQQAAFEASISEEEEDEENESCHSSSSDTLTCSITEDLEETLGLSDVQSEDMSEIKLPQDVKEMESLPHQFEIETSLKEARLSSLQPGLNTSFGSKDHETTRSDTDVGESFSPQAVTAESPLTGIIPPAEEEFKAAAPDRRKPPNQESIDNEAHRKSPQVSPAVEDTRMIPYRPITPFTAKRESEEEDEDLLLTTAPAPHLEQIKVSTHSVEGCAEPQQCFEVPVSLAGREHFEEKQHCWIRLHSQISQKLIALKKVEEHQSLVSKKRSKDEKISEKQLIPTGCASAILHQTHESITMLRQILRVAVGSDPHVKKELYEAVQQVLLCLDSLTDLLLTPGSSEDEHQLWLLQQECASAEIKTLVELMGKVESEVIPALSKEEPGTHSCWTCLKDCLHLAQLIVNNQLIEHPGIKDLSSNQLCLLDEFELGQNDIFSSLKEVPSLENVLCRHLRESLGEKAKLQQASRSLLRGIAHLLQLAEKCITERQMNQVHSRSKLQAVLGRHKKLWEVLWSQLAFVKYLFQHQPEALRCQEDEWVQLEVRAKALQQQALEQYVASQRRLQEWTCWEDCCARLGRVLDESEAFISGGEPEGDNNEEAVQRRLVACQKMLVLLDESRAAAGLLLDQQNKLQADPGFPAPVCQAGGALEPRWRGAYRRTEQEIQRCKDIQDSRTRFQADFASVSNWLVGANKHLKTLSGPTEASDLSQERVRNNLIKLLDFSMEMQAMSLKRASVSKDATRLLYLREADCPGLRAELTQLEVSWNQLTSDMSKIQDQLQQRLLAAHPPVELLSDLEDWLKKMDAQLNQEKETVFNAKDAAEISEILQHYQILKAAVANGQLLLDFLCQPGPQVLGADVQAARSEHTIFAEKLGTFRLQWFHLQRELESQIHGAEQIHHTCAKRQRRLQSLNGRLEQQKKQLNQWKQPTSQTQAHKALLEWEASVSRVTVVAAALQEVKTKQVHDDEHQCDVAFSSQAESVCQACGDLGQQMDALRPALQQTVEDWSCFHKNLRDATLHTTRLRCALQQQQAPLFSLKQAEAYSDLLQQLQVKAANGEELWATVDKSLHVLMEKLPRRAAQALWDQVEGERKRWRETMQEIQDEHMNTGRTLSLWQEYTCRSDSCSLRLQQLWRQWEEPSRSSFSPEQDAQAMVCSVTLQDAAEELQSGVGDVLAASKPLIGRLEPMAADLILSETRLLSREFLLLKQVVSGKKKSLQDAFEQQKQFYTKLEALDEQTQNTMHKLHTGKSNKDSVKHVLLELISLLPALVDIREVNITLDNRETKRLHALTRKWAENLTHISDTNRGLEAEHQRPQSFAEKRKSLTSLQETLERDSVSRKPLNYSNLQQMMTVHQRLQAEMIIGHQLLQGLLCDAVQSIEKEKGEKRSKVMLQVACVKESWFKTIGVVVQNRMLMKEQLQQWRVYHQGSKLVWKLLRDIDSLLPPTGPSLYTLQQLPSCVDGYQCVEESVGLHSPVYTLTLEAGKHLCDAMTESECRSQLQSDLQAVEEAWEQTTSLLQRRKHQVNNTVQMWSQCQDGVTNIMTELDELQLKLSEKPKDPDREERAVQETELSLQRLAGGLSELSTMKTDLSQYVAASDTALLEQQLEQLHSQWEELCMKVSLHRQEIADRLNAWTIFNDKNKEFCDWLTQMENKVCHSGDLSIEEMVEKLKKDCMEEINLFSENKSHLKQLGEQLLLASDEAKQSQVRGSLQEVNQRWHNLFHHIEARVKKLKETLVTVQQLDKNMSNLRSWLSRIEAELSRPITYSVCHEQEIQKRLAEQQELQRDIEQHTEGVASVLSLCDVLLRDEDAAGGTDTESDSLQETSRSLDQRWRTICAMALDRRLRIEETYRLWCKFLNDYSRFEDWLTMAERTAANPNSADILYTIAKEELKKFEGFQRQVHERLTQLELVNNQYRRLARENRTDRASQLKAMIHSGNRRWDTLHRRVAAILRRLKYFTSQREDFEGTRESMLVWLTELDLQLTNVEHFSESDVHHKIQQLNSFQKEITVNTERIDALIVFGEGLIQKSSPQDAALIEDELEELHSYCQEVFSRLVRFHQRLSQPPMVEEEPELSRTTFSLESSLELIGRKWLGRSQGSLPATPTHLLASPLERSGRETPVSVDSLPLEWDHTGDVGGSSSHEDDDEDEEEHEEEGTYFSAEVELTESQDELMEAPDCSLVSNKSVRDSPRWRPPPDTETQHDTDGHAQAPATLTSTPLKQGYLRLMSQCSGSIEDIKRVSLILDDEEQPEEFGLTGLSASDKQSGVIERWELLQAQSRHSLQEGPQELSDLDDITSWLESAIPELNHLQQSDPATSIEDMEASAKELKEMQKKFAHYKSVMLSVNLHAEKAPELQERLTSVNRDWSRACTGLQQWETGLRVTLTRCQEFHESLHSLLLWLAHAESRRYAVDVSHPDTGIRALQQHRDTLTDLQEELWDRQAQQASLQALWSQLQPEEGADESDEAKEKLHVTGSKLKLLLRQVEQDLGSLQQRLDYECAAAVQEQSASAETSVKQPSAKRESRESSPPRSFFYRVLRAAFPLQLLLLLLLLLPCLIPMSESDTSCSVTNNFARSFYPMLRYTNGPPPT
ncbi:nesprin-2a isoform X3 [Parambassis ranga]|uniref:Nesprin-2a isoform X3 n=1 Tax=Parambassis ranga TaxID=210632 RepID=A0A6P7HAM8_9TELE|nr:nesprin-2-like isoform X3 [Parambassis ranga]